MESILLFVPGMPGGPEMIIILVLVVLLFGANKLPKLARASGASIGEFQKGRQEVEQELQAMTDLEDDEEHALMTDEEDTVLEREPRS